MLFDFVKLILELGAMAALLWSGYRTGRAEDVESRPLPADQRYTR